VKFLQGHHNWAPNAGAVKKLRLWQLTRYISKMVQDKCIVSMKGEQKLLESCMHVYQTLTLLMTLGVHNHPTSPLFLHFWSSLISGEWLKLVFWLLYAGKPHKVLDLRWKTTPKWSLSQSKSCGPLLNYGTLSYLRTSKACMFTCELENVLGRSVMCVEIEGSVKVTDSQIHCKCSKSPKSVRQIYSYYRSLTE